MNKSLEFVNWVKVELEGRDMSRSTLARKAGLSKAYVSDVLNLQQPPGIKFYKGIAKAFVLPFNHVLVRAGEAPTPPDANLKRDKMAHLFDKISEERQDYFIDLLSWEIERSTRSDE